MRNGPRLNRALDRQMAVAANQFPVARLVDFRSCAVLLPKRLRADAFVMQLCSIPRDFGRGSSSRTAAFQGSCAIPDASRQASECAREFRIAWWLAPQFARGLPGTRQC